MDFDLNEDQQEIKSVAHELLSARSSWPATGGVPS